MILDADRQTTLALVRAGTWKMERGIFRTVEIVPVNGGKALLEAMKRRQVLDNLHHAPGCPANHFHRRRLVFQRCTCGANQEMRAGSTSPPLKRESKRDVIYV